MTNVTSNHSYLLSISNICPMATAKLYCLMTEARYLTKSIRAKSHLQHERQRIFVCILVFASVWTRGPKPSLPPLGHIWYVMLVQRKGNIEKNCLCATVLCTITVWRQC